MCTVLGWFLGNAHRSSRTAIVDRDGSTPTPALAKDALAGSSRRNIDVHEVIAGIRADFKDDDYHGEERAARVFHQFRDLEDDDFLAAIANLSSERDWVGADAARLLAGYWAERDLPAARSWALGLSEGVARNFCTAVFETWSRNDLPGMFEWIENHADELPSKQHRDGVAFPAAKAAWRLDPERGMRLLRRLDPNGEGFIWNLYHDWAEHDPAAASTRALEEVDPTIRDRIIFAVTSAWAPRDPFAAKAWAEKIPDPLIAQKTVTHIGSVLGWSDPPASADYLVQIPQTNETRAALKEVVGNWAECDLDATLKRAAALDDKPVGDWVADEVKAKLPQNRRATVEERWRQLRNISSPQPPTAR
jgi:hypothetical protein